MLIASHFWSKKPFNSLYILLKVVHLLWLLPGWTLYYLPHKNRGRPSWTLKESIMVKLKRASSGWSRPSVRFLQGVAGDAEAYIWPKGASVGACQMTIGTGSICLFLHGGGVMMGHAGETYPECVLHQLPRRRATDHFVAVDYRLAHEGRHPAQLIDAIAGYVRLVHDAGVDPKRIVVTGACAGGHLALMLIRYLVDEKVLPLPGGLMLFSPWVDMKSCTRIDEEISKGLAAMRPNEKIDMLCTSIHANLRFIGDKSVDIFDTPLMSSNRSPPGAFTPYPKTFISVGECDAFHEECRQVAAKMKEDGVKVLMDTQPDAVHDFVGMDGVPSAPAREKALQLAASWLVDLA
ncbi:Alpha/Beta hydrolase protein [Coprinopsis sp. MPI-PUGE-AT-0042]|nr:Alpha/Beta hydrolase protein [Coprinopsis sp. MPI-PUGE-AT-0042]